MRHRARDGPREANPIVAIETREMALGFTRTSLPRRLTTSGGDCVVGRAKGPEQGRALTSGASAR